MSRFQPFSLLPLPPRRDGVVEAARREAARLLSMAPQSPSEREIERLRAHVPSRPRVEKIRQVVELVSGGKLRSVERIIL